MQLVHAHGVELPEGAPSVVADSLVDDVERLHVLHAEPLLAVQPPLGELRVEEAFLSAVEVDLQGKDTMQITSTGLIIKSEKNLG